MTTTSDDLTLSLFDVSTKLGVSPSAIKKRVAHLNIPVKRGARGKLIFDRHAYGLLAQADEMLKAGQGFEDCRRALGLEAPEAVTDVEAAPEEAPELAVVLDEVLADEPETLELLVPATEVIEETPVVAESLPVLEPEAAAVPVVERQIENTEAASDSEQPLPQPVFLQFAKRKQAAAQAAPERDPKVSLDAALKLLEDKEKHNQMLHSKLLVAYDEMTKLSATAAAFQERSLNLQHEVNKLQGELRLLAAPAAKKPWWKFWG